MEVLTKIDTEKAKEAANRIKDKLLKSEIIKIGSLVALALILVLFFLPLFFNNSQLKFQIEQKISGTYLTSFNIRGDVSIAFVPRPAIIAKDVILRNYRPKINEHFESDQVYDFHAKEVRIESSFFSLSKINSITLIEPVLEGYNSLHKPQTRSDKFVESAENVVGNVASTQVIKSSGISAKIFSIEDAAIDISKLPHVVVKDGELSIFDSLLRRQKFKNISFESSFSMGSNKIEGEFVTAGDKNNFRLVTKYNSAASRPTSFFELSSPALKLNVKGNFTAENNGIFLSDFKGRIEAEISDLKAFYRNYISAENVINDKLKRSSSAIKINGDISNIAGDMVIDNLLINSPLVEGRGEIYINLTKKIPMVDVNFDLENLDLDGIWSNDSLSQDAVAMAQAQQVVQNDVTKTGKVDAEKTDKINDNDSALEDDLRMMDGVITQIKDLDLTSEINIKNVKFLEGEIENVSSYLSSSKQGEILLLPMTFNVPGEGSFWVSGVFDNNSALPKFIGKVNAFGADFSQILHWLKFEAQNLKFDSLKKYNTRFDVLLSPSNTAISNFYLDLNDKKSEVVGEIKSTNTNNISNTVSKFTISDFNCDDYFLTASQSTYLSPGMLIKKMLWLNNIMVDNDILLRFYKLTYKNEEFLDQNIHLKIGKGRFVVDDLRLKSGNTDLRFSLNVDISNNNPRFELLAEANDFRYSSFASNDSANSFLASTIKAIKSDKQQNFIDRFYALPSLEGFDGKVQINFQNLMLDNFNVKYAKLNGKIKDGSINVSDMSGEVYGGSFIYRGIIGIKINKIINGNLAMNNIAIKPLLTDLFGIDNVSGVANISSSIVSGVSKKEKFSESLLSDTRFVVNAPSIDRYGLNDLIQKMFDQQANQKALREPEKILFNDGSSSGFKDAKGTVQFSGSGEGKIRVDLSSSLANGVLSGMVNLPNKSIDSLFNVIFLTGTMQKQIPINIATNIKGDLSNISHSSNLDQVSQYLGLKSMRLNNEVNSQ